MLKCQLYAQVEVREESPALLEGAALDEADAVKQLAQKLDACALEEHMDAIIKTEDTPSPGEAPPDARMLTGIPLRTVRVPAAGQKLAACLLIGTRRPSQPVKRCAPVLLILIFVGNSIVVSCCAALSPPISPLWTLAAPRHRSLRRFVQAASAGRHEGTVTDGDNMSAGLPCSAVPSQQPLPRLRQPQDSGGGDPQHEEAHPLRCQAGCQRPQGGDPLAHL